MAQAPGQSTGDFFLSGLTFITIIDWALEDEKHEHSSSSVSQYAIA